MQPMVYEGAEAGQKSPIAQVSVHSIRMKIVVWLFVEVGGSVIDGRD